MCIRDRTPRLSPIPPQGLSVSEKRFFRRKGILFPGRLPSVPRTKGNMFCSAGGNTPPEIKPARISDVYKRQDTASPSWTETSFSSPPRYPSAVRRHFLFSSFIPPYSNRCITYSANVIFYRLFYLIYLFYRDFLYKSVGYFYVLRVIFLTCLLYTSRCV